MTKTDFELVKISRFGQMALAARCGREIIDCDTLYYRYVGVSGTNLRHAISLPIVCFESK